MQLNEVQNQIWADRYALKDSDGVLIDRNINDTFRRVSFAIGGDDRYFEMIASGKFMPAGRILANAGAHTDTTLLNCYVMPSPEDSRVGILDNLKLIADVMARGGGVGINISSLRPRGTHISTVNGTSSGPVSWAELYSVLTGDIIQQGGCFIGSTMVATVDGPKRIMDIQKGELVYGWDGAVGLFPSSAAFRTRDTAEVWKITTDKGFTFYSTPDHKLLRRSSRDSASYVEVHESVGKPVMPFSRYYKKKDGWFITAHDGANSRWREEHLILKSTVGFDPSKIVHHIDGDHANNAPSNLTQITQEQHATLHSRQMLDNGTHPFQHLSDESKAKSVAGYSKWFSELPSEEQSRIQSDRAVSLNAKLVANGTHNFIGNKNGVRGSVGYSARNKSSIARSLWTAQEAGYALTADSWPTVKGSIGLSTPQQFTVPHIESIFGSFDNAVAYASANNQRIVSAEFSHYEDVYDIEVETAHNFAIVNDTQTNGVFVSNSRRGALMLTLNVDHPDILEFIRWKHDNPGKLKYANLSVVVTDLFMDCVIDGTTNSDRGNWNLIWDGKVHSTVKARDIWQAICEAAWASGEPGVVFIDEVNRNNNAPTTLIGPNPCGEYFGEEFGVCNLGALDLSHFVEKGKVNTANLAATTRLAVQFLDQVLDVTPYVSDENRKAAMSTRRIGLGVMGLAHALFKMELTYGSTEANQFINIVFEIIRDSAYAESVRLAEKWGPFPLYDGKQIQKSDFYNRLPIELQTDILFHGLRNASLMAMAPTGTISQLSGTSSGIEPVYALSYTRKDKIGERVVLDPVYEAWVMTQPAGKIEIPDYFVTAKNLSTSQHVEVQALIQSYVDGAVSKTINAPNDATVEDVSKAYMMAANNGVKGLTFFRDGSREGVLSESTTPIKEALPASSHEPTRALKWRVNLSNEDGGTDKFHITITQDENEKPYEVFINGGRRGQAEYALLGRLISQALKSGTPVEEVIDNCWAVMGQSIAWGYGTRPLTCLGNAVGWALGQFVGDRVIMLDGKTPVPVLKPGDVAIFRQSCPSCGSTDLTWDEACGRKCKSCGWMKCGG